MMSSSNKMLIIFMDERDVWAGMPLYEEVLQRLKDHEVAGATVLPGLSGYGDQLPLYRGPSRPVAVLSVDSEAKFREVMPDLEPILGERFMVLTDAELVGSLSGAPVM
ncbi:MAG: DUF190 domain-containing protein [Bryobacteraceae bacterium]